MAAYAALVTLMHTIEQIQHHPRLPISLDKNQVESLTEKVTFLQEFLEGYSYGLELESRIADAARAAEDIIESHVVDRILDRGGANFYKYLLKARQILAGCTGCGEKNFHKCLQKVVDNMDLIKKVVVQIKETITPIRLHLRRDSARWDPLRSSFMVGFDDVLIEMMDKLTGYGSSRQIIPIAGMGGSGKSTLARHVYSKMLIQQHFDVCAWTTISQQYNIREIFIEVVSQITKVARGDLLEKSENELKETVHKFLVGRRYLIILDDIWDIEVWDEVQLFFPDCNNGSRVVITTRLSNLASQVNDSYCHKMKFLDEGESWNLFCKVVFGEENCPVDLEEIGKKIARGCKGLPLSICVVGGLLANSKDDEVEYWEYIAKNLNSVVNLEDNERCLKILHMSYSHLPTHLKPCFLYMGVFAEDEIIRVSKLIELWVAEGFLKPIGGKTPEEVAKEYFNELIERNLISAHNLGCVGAIKCCKIHDLLRDFCLRQTEKERFDNVLELHNLYNYRRGIGTKPRRPRLDNWSRSLQEKHHDAFRSLQLATSLYYYSWTHPATSSFLSFELDRSANSRLLRIWVKCRQSFFLRYGNSLETMLQSLPKQPLDGLSCSADSIWNLETLVTFAWWVINKPSKIWKMPNLRHVKVMTRELPDPRDGNDIVLGNLETLTVKNFTCSEAIIKRIPNIKKLRITYTYDGEDERISLHNFGRLCKLESLYISFRYMQRPIDLQNLTFPNSLMKLEIHSFPADEILEKIGSLPLLVKLKLELGYFGKHEWVTVEGQFPSLRFLQVEECNHLECWKTESSHFPRLEHLTLRYIYDLKEIPLDIVEIPTLRSIRVEACSNSLVDSANNIRLEQEELGNEDLQVEAFFF